MAGAPDDDKRPDDPDGPAVQPADAAASGSVDVAFSDSSIPQAVTALETGPVGRSKRLTKAVQDVVSGGVEVLGSAIGTIGEGVTQVGDVTKNVPLVGAGVGKLGEGLTKAGESIHALPRVAQTRRGRLLVRSVVVGFLIVFSWIAAIVFVQLRS